MSNFAGSISQSIEACVSLVPKGTMVYFFTTCNFYFSLAGVVFFLLVLFLLFELFLLFLILLFVVVVWGC